MSSIRCDHGSRTRHGSHKLLAGDAGGSEIDVAPWKLPQSGQSVVFCAWREAWLVNEDPGERYTFELRSMGEMNTMLPKRSGSSHRRHIVLV